MVLKRDHKYTPGEIWKNVETLWVAVGTGGRYCVWREGTKMPNILHPCIPGG